MADKALVILSGGQDSTACLFWAKEYYAEVHAITFDYGQRHRIELEAAARVAQMAGVSSHEFLSIPNILVSTSPLVSDNVLEQYQDADQMDKVIGDRRELTFVPMRNALFLVIAANRAEALIDCDLVTGVCQADGANYDDCREIFIGSMEDSINNALGHDHRDEGNGWITVQTPLMDMSKKEIVSFTHNLGVDAWRAMAFTHTSYDGKYPPTDKNHANVLRAKGFLEAGRPDPLVLRACLEKLMELPETANYDPYRV